ncbi:hypothetical protein HS088_TW04G00032 [Tripterygium wilfordii]|uniref:Uncharacterized protein n=1 Tax=Tripterygium wilfordii TaxID=458696 RepID=A0A7J7DP72_TRIWF|nr:hypothetical protein HS088_TW04G00032 [Tripterygium wilfordii]
MGRNGWSVLRHLKKAVKKVSFLLRFNNLNWSRLASSMLSRSFKIERRRRFSFNDRRGLRCIDDEEDLESKGSGSIQRTRSCGSEDDIDRRAEAFISNFRQQLWLERQISMELRYCRRNVP